ncbi:unnamed protein product [Triticum turgidum subsp. durum]|uniref:Uncharacterized protein n=1 Tax=Triticum turgidum subsp. durum TaxID=4567 RepID=A0A9R1C2C9_TRITD|nr:unnamed protein product [Triticum turgidum subsp. durum]
MTKDVEMAARNGSNGAVAGEAYYPPPPAQGGDVDVDDDGKQRRTGKQHDAQLSYSLPSTRVAAKLRKGLHA